MKRSSEDGSLDATLPSADGLPPPSQQVPAQDRTLPTGEMAAVADIEKGTQIGRYVVVEPLGSGTMGLVVAAFDPTLDRKVAIKVVRLDPAGTTSGRQRLIREAQAMAKLQHPNVVTVFEVGTFQDQLFLAMEYVAGSTLADWLPGRPQKEIIAAFVAAGNGLAAAHRAGIVHRDFKPHNVLVGTDGRVRVADFGLATATAEAPPPAEISRDSDPGPLGMTKTGAILGTPAYMSPEQYLGEPADARADQYAFCVALYEALYGELPCEGTSFLVYRDNVIAGRVREAPKDSKVPAKIRRVLLRGLSASPAARYPDLDALLVELDRDPRSKQVAIAAAVAGAALAVGLGSALWARHHVAGDPCADADKPLAAMWSEADRAALKQAFAASGSPGASAAYDRLAAVLDKRVTGLRAARREACEATAVRHEQSEELLDRRVACVDARADATAALIHVLAEQHDPETLAKGAAAVQGLPPLEPCADREALLAAANAQPPPQIRPHVDDLERRLDRIEAMSDAGLWVKASDELATFLPEVDAAGWHGCAAHAHHLAGNIAFQLEHNEQAVVELKKAAELASAAHDDTTSAEAWIELYAAVGYRLGHTDEAKGLEQAAAAAVVRAGNPPVLVGQLANARGLNALGKDDYLGAAKQFHASADALGKAGIDRTPELADALTNEGTSLIWAEKYDEAKAPLDRALGLRIETLGAEHPDVAFSYHALGVLYDTSGDPAKALAEFQKSDAITQKAYPPDSAHVAEGMVSTALVLGEMENHDESVALLEKALAIFEAHAADTQQEMSTAMFDLGLAYMNAHRTKDAVAMLKRALAQAEAQNGPDSDEAAAVLGGLLGASDLAGDHEAARAYGERSLAIREKLRGGDSEQAARVMGDLASNAIARKDPQGAMKLIDRALGIIEAPGAPALAVRFEMRQIRARALLALKKADAAYADAVIARDGFAGAGQPVGAADARLVVADALWAQGKRADAVAEAKQALAELAAQGKPDATEVALAKKWLAGH